MSEDLLEDTLPEEAQAELHPRLQEEVADEQEQPQEQLEFTDSRGVVRTAHERAPEIVITPEIADVVDGHFGQVYDTLSTVDDKLDDLEHRLSREDECKIELFNPLDDSFLDQLKEKVLLQIPEVTVDSPIVKTIKEEKRTIFGRKKIVERKVETTEKVAKDGYVQALSEAERESISTKFYKYETERHSQTHPPVIRTSESKLQRRVEVIQKLTEKLLLDDSYDPQEAKNQGKSGQQRLPALATRLVQTGVQPETLTMEILYDIMPELKPIAESIQQVRDIAYNGTIDKTAREIQKTIDSLQPDGRHVTTVFYSDRDIAEINARYNRLCAVMTVHYPDKADSWPPAIKSELTDEVIRRLFSFTYRADEVLFHGTAFGPRIIKSGHLKPSAGMDRSEYTFNSGRHMAGYNPKSVGEGTNALHWSGRMGLTYDKNLEPGVWLDKEWLTEQQIQEEEAKGGLGHMVMAVRLGDIIKQASIGGRYDLSHEEGRRRSHGDTKFAILRLTPRGMQQVEELVGTHEKVRDIAYAAASGSASKEEAFSYAIPLDNVLKFAIGSRNRDQIIAAMKEAGWNDEDIAKKTELFAESALTLTDIPTKIQREAIEEGKYKNCLIVPLVHVY